LNVRNSSTSAILQCSVHSMHRTLHCIARSVSQPRWTCAADALFLCGCWASCYRTRCTVVQRAVLRLHMSSVRLTVCLSVCLSVCL